MILTAEQLAQIMPKADAVTWAAALTPAMAEFEISTPTRVAHFLGQLAHESIELTRREENLNYSSRRLIEVWPKRFNAVSAEMYAHSPEKLANYVYAGRYGNGDEASGDGWRYRGRGPMQLTFRSNYAAAGKGIGLTLEEQPDLVLDPKVGARTAAWYWHDKGLNALADVGKLEAITRAINGGVLGLADRTRNVARAFEVLNGAT